MYATCSAWLPAAEPGRSSAATCVSVGVEAVSLANVKMPGLPFENGTVPSKSSIVETAPSFGSGLLLRMLTVVLLLGPITTPDGEALASATWNVLVGSCSEVGSAVRWIGCVVTPGAKVSVPAAAV